MRIQMLRFADGIVIIVQDEINLKKALESLDAILKSNYKMKINRGGKKTEVMVCSQAPGSINIKADDNALQQVPKFKYLGSIFTENGKNKKQLLCSNNLSLEMKRKLIKSCIWSVAPYGSGTWTLRKNEERAVNAFETWCWRRMSKIKWTDRITNDEVFQRVKKETLLLKILKNGHHSWLGHTIRQNEFVVNILEGAISGKKAMGRPRLQYLKQVARNTGTELYSNEKNGLQQFQMEIWQPVKRLKDKKKTLRIAFYLFYIFINVTVHGRTKKCLKSSCENT